MSNLIERMNKVSENIEKEIQANPEKFIEEVKEKEAENIRDNLIKDIVDMIIEEVPVIKNIEAMNRLVQSINVEKTIFQQNIKKRVYSNSIMHYDL